MTWCEGKKQSTALVLQSTIGSIHEKFRESLIIKKFVKKEYLNT